MLVDIPCMACRSPIRLGFPGHERHILQGCRCWRSTVRNNYSCRESCRDNNPRAWRAIITRSRQAIFSRFDGVYGLLSFYNFFFFQLFDIPFFSLSLSPPFLFFCNEGLDWYSREQPWWAKQRKKKKKAFSLFGVYVSMFVCACVGVYG